MIKKIAELSQKQSQVFEKYFLEDNGEFYFEGVWFRDQRKENAAACTTYNWWNGMGQDCNQIDQPGYYLPLLSGNPAGQFLSK